MMRQNTGLSNAARLTTGAQESWAPRSTSVVGFLWIVFLTIATAIVTMLDYRVGLGLVGLCAAIGFYFAVQLKARRSLPLSGVLVLAIGVCGSLGFVFYPQIQNKALVSYAVPNDAATYAAAYSAIAWSLVAVFSGAWFFIRPMRATRTSAVEPARTFDRMLGSRAGLLLVIASIPLALYILGYTPKGLLHRDHYLAIAGPQVAVSFASVTGPVAVGLIAMVLVSAAPRGGHRLLALLLGVALFLVLFSTGSRSLGLVPLALMWVYFELRSPSLGRKLAALSIGVPAFLILFNAPLLLRYNVAGAGFLPYVEWLSAHFFELFQIDAAQLLGNILFGVPLTGDIARGGGLPSENFWVAINPLPGQLSGWPAILDQYSWAPATPYNSFGELQAYGAAYALLFMFVIGAVISLLDNLITHFDPAVARIARLVALISVLLFCASMFQYPIRNATRVIWYLAAGLTCLYFAQGLFRELHKAKSTSRS